VERIASLDEVPEEGTYVFRVRNGVADAPVDEAVLIRAGDGVQAWINRCQHWTDVRLDEGDGATVRNGEIVCQKHGAHFEADTGYCNYGPCEGARLPSVDVEEREDGVYLIDEGYDFVGRGPMEEENGEVSGTRGGDDFEL
jgi:nitrite reductase/ring-hydroxylating ferredoxin subunit